MMSWKLSGVAVLLFSWVIAGIIAKLEASVGIVTATANLTINHIEPNATDDAADAKLQRQSDILRDHFLLAWVIGGSIPGACVGIWIRTLTKVAEIAKTFSVSLFTSFCASPWIVQNYLSTAPSTCLLVGFLVAVGSWVAWEIAIILAMRMKDAASKRGWLGVKQEIFGDSSAIVSTGKTISPLPKAPGASPDEPAKPPEAPKA